MKFSAGICFSGAAPPKIAFFTISALSIYFRHMNFAHLLLTKTNTYRFICNDSPDTIMQEIDSLAARKSEAAVSDFSQKAEADAEMATPAALSTAQSNRPGALQTVNSVSQSVKDAEFDRMRIKKLNVTKRSLKQNSYTKFRFEAGRSTNFLRSLFQPRIFGNVSGAGSETTVELKTELPLLPTKLINWSGNIALFSLFGMFGSYLLLPNPQPLMPVLVKATLLPGMFALLVSFVCQYFLQTDSRALADDLAEKGRARSLETIPTDASKVLAKTFFSLNSLITLLACACILAAACLLHNWAWQQWTSGKYTKSEELCLNVLDLARISLGKDSAGVAGCEYYIAECSRCEGKLEQAEKFYLQSLADLERNVEPSNTSIADTVINLGRVYEEQNKLEKALSNYARARKIFEAAPAFGPRCIWIGHIWNRIAAIQMKQKNYAEAEQSENKALVIDTAYKWLAGQSIAQDTNDLGVIYYQQGKYEQARRAFAEALRLKADLPEASSYSKGTSLYNLSFAQDKLGQKEWARTSMKQAIAYWQKYLGIKGASGLSAHDLYAKVLKAAKPEYEVPNYDRRADLIIDGLGRI
jgi:tetratricopeptide (TPR) repeat protein